MILTTAAGIKFVHNNGRSGKRYLPDTLGSGGAFFDADGDGCESVVARKLDERSNVGESARIFAGATYQRARDLQLVQLRRDGPAGRIRDSDAVEGDARARRGEPCDGRTRGGAGERRWAELEGDGPGAEGSERFQEDVHPRELRG